MIDPSDGLPFAAIAARNGAGHRLVPSRPRSARATAPGAGSRRSRRAGFSRRLARAILDHADELALHRGARLRQADEAGARRRRRVRAILRVLRRRVRQAARRDDSLSGRLFGAHVARAARRHRPHHPVELSDADLRALGRRRARGRQRLRREARRGRVPVVAAHRRARRGRRASRRRDQPRDGARTRSGRGARRASRASSICRSPARRRPARVSPPKPRSGTAR